MGKETKTIIAIDPGSAQFTVLGARSAPDYPLEIVAVGRAPSLGVQRGMITNVEEAGYAFRAALEDAGLEGRVKDAEVFVGISGKHLAGANRQGEAAVARKDGQVTEKDIEAAMAAAREMDLGDERVLLHQVSRYFRVDGYRCRRSPEGMHGARVLVETHLISAPASAVADLKRAVQVAGKNADRVVASGLAASHAVLRRDEQEGGVVLMDIGHGCTSMVAYTEGSICHTSVLPLGGQQLVKDIGISLNTSLHVADGLLREHGAGAPDGLDLERELTIPCYGVSGERRLRLRYLLEVIRLRLTEIMQLGLAQVRQTVPEAPFQGGLVLTGGVARLRGIEPLARAATGMPVRVGSVGRAANGPDALQGPAYATVMGILRAESNPALAAVEPGPEARRFPRLPQLISSRA